MKDFQALGAELMRAWQGHNYDEQAFGALATSLLRERRLHERFDIERLWPWVLTEQAEMPPQRDSDFGQPAVTVFQTERMLMEVLVWADSTTAIHQHAFSGAFQVLHGGSVHTPYTFELQRRVNSTFLLGQVRRGTPELLRRGDVREIRSGASFIHSLFHLDHPSVSLVVRTVNERDQHPQWSYLPPHVAVDPFIRNARLLTRLRALSTLRTCEPERYPAFLAQFLESADLESAFFALREDLAAGPSEAERLARAAALLEKRYPDVAGLLLATLREDVRLKGLIARRRDVRAAGPRHLLALLLNLQNRDEILKWVGPPNPAEKVVEWLSELTGIRPDGTVQVLDVELEGASDEAERVKRLALSLIAGMLQPLEDPVGRVAAENPDVDRESLAGLYQVLRASPSLAPLWRTAPN